MSISESETGIQTKAPRPAPSEAIEDRITRPRKKKSPLMFAIGVISSLRLTVILFALSVLLVFFGTLAQVEGGIWTIVNTYFRSIVVWIPFAIFFPEDIRVHVHGGFPFPGGWLLGGLLMTNLAAAHIRLIAEGYKKWASGRLGFPWRLPGILLIHSGLVVLMVSEFITGLWAVEGNMSIDQGKSSYAVVQNRFAELAVIDSSHKTDDDVVVVPQSFLRAGAVIKHEYLPFDVHIDQYFVNSDVKKIGKNDNVPKNLIGDWMAVDRAEIAGTSQEQTADAPSAYVTLKDKTTGKSLGTYLFSARLPSDAVKVGEKVYAVALRFKHTYRPFSIYLKEFRFDRYPGTEIAKNFSSQVIINDPERNVRDWQVTIRMNEPLRYRGETFFQASFDHATETTTILQVVDNPGWLLPYIACVMVALGMLIHFDIVLVRFLMKTMGR